MRENNKMKIEKVFMSLRSFIDDHHEGKTKFCTSCGNIATQEALFNVGGSVTLIKRYCDLCAIIVGGFRPTLI
jgi:hypothetical protein